MKRLAAVAWEVNRGPDQLERAKLRRNPDPFVSRLLGVGVTKIKALESLVIASAAESFDSW